jgi:chorismate dehydratase
MWDFEHPPADALLTCRYQIDPMRPSACARRLASGEADIAMIPIAALATTPGLRILPGCAIASRDYARSLLLVRRASQPLAALRSAAADAASLTAVACARLLFHKWGNPGVPFLPMAANLDLMLERADAAILIGDPALLALEERHNRFERSGEELIYHDLAHEWRALTGLPFVSAVWGVARGGPLDESVARDFIQSRDHGLENIEALVAEWAPKMAIPEQTIRSYFTTNIHYVLDEECIEAMRAFFRMAAEAGILPAYDFSVPEAPAR